MRSVAKALAGLLVGTILFGIAPAAAQGRAVDLGRIAGEDELVSGTYIRGTGVFANAQGGNSGAVPASAPDRDIAPDPGQARLKSIDVETGRLDRQPIPPGGISIHRVGSAKIIRLSPVRAAAPEPWSEEWRGRCARRHASFDAVRGTYRGPDGRLRFCTADPV